MATSTLPAAGSYEAGRDTARLRRSDVAALGALLLLIAWYVRACLHLGARPEEDAAMLLRYSEHLARGYGIVWNVGERPVDGATDFLFMLMVAAVHRFGVPVEGAATWIGLAAHTATALALYLGTRRLVGAPPVLALVPSVFFALGPGLRHLAAGYGTPLFTLFALLAWLPALSLVEREGPLARPALHFAVAALALGLARPEGVFLGGFMLLAVLAVRAGAGAREIVKPYALVFLTLGLAYFAWHWIYFGHPLPNPFYAKSAGAPHWHSLRMSLRDLWRLTFPLGMLLPVGLFFRASRRTTLMALLPVASFAALWLVISDEANYAMRFRAPVLALVLVGATAALHALVTRRPRPDSERGFALALAAAAVLGALQHSRYDGTAPRRMGLYDAATVLRPYAPRGFTLVTTEAGLLPLHSEWRAVDAWGLNDSWIAHHGGITEEYLDRYRPELIVFHAYFSPGTPESGPRIENRALGPRWYRMVMTLKGYAESRGYVRAAVFGRNAYDTHWFFVRSGFPQSAEIVARLRDLDYQWDGEPTVDFRDGDRGEEGAANDLQKSGATLTPPSTQSVAPVIHRAAGDARNRHASATSSGRPRRRRGAASSQRETPSGHVSSIPSRQMRPGATALTRMPWGPSSWAAARVWASAAAFVAA
jgi:arabinofuranosyltransferase